MFKIPFGIVFSSLFVWPKIKKSVCFPILLNGFGLSKTIDFRKNKLFEPLHGAVLRGSQCQTFINNWLLVPFYISMIFKKVPCGQPFRSSRRKKRSAPNDPDCPSRDPAFHETMVIIVPFGPSVFLNFIFSIKIGSFRVFSDFRCAMFDMQLLSHVSHLLIIPR